LVDLTILLEGTIIEVLVFWLKKLKANADFSTTVGSDKFLHRKGIQNVSLIFKDRVLTKLVTKYNTTLSFVSQTSLKVFGKYWISLYVRNPRFIAGRFKKGIHFFRGSIIPHDH